MKSVQMSVVIPVYNSASILPKFYERLKKAMDALGETYEMVFLDDGSPDDSWTILKGIQQQDENVRAVRLLNNYGQQKAVLCGFHLSSGSYVVTIDDDLQQRPEDIRILYDKICSDECLDVVVGRYPKKKHGIVRGLGTKLVKLLSQKTVGIPRDLDLTSFRIVRGRIARETSKLRNRNPVVGFLLFKITQRFANVDVNHDLRTIGRSNYSMINLIKYFIHMVVDYSDLLLRCVGYSGFAVAIFSMLMGLYYFGLYYMQQITVSGFTTIVLLLCAFFGVMMMSLATIGVYMLRVLDRTDVVPTFLTREELGFRDNLVV